MEGREYGGNFANPSHSFSNSSASIPYLCTQTKLLLVSKSCAGLCPAESHCTWQDIPYCPEILFVSN